MSNRRSRSALSVRVLRGSSRNLPGARALHRAPVRWRRIEMLRRALCVVVLVTFTLATVALADPPTVAIEQQATLATGGVEVTVVVNCGDGPSMAEVEVQVRQGEAAFTSFAFPFESTGD